jgi:hypothetical protein
MKPIFLCFLILILFLGFKTYAQDQPTKLTIDAKQHLVKTLEKQLIDNYIFADTGRRMALFIDKRLTSGAYDTIRDVRFFGKTLTDDVRSVYHDRHFSVRYSPAMADRLTKGGVAVNKEEEQRVLQQGRTINFGFAKAEILDGNIGCIKLDGFWDVNPESMKTVKAALGFVSNSKALIFDLRDNHGGDPAMVQFICGFLFKDKTHINDLYERRTKKLTTFFTNPDTSIEKLNGLPIYILTSRITFSAGEEFTYDLQTQKRALVIGETTGGGAHPLDFYNLGYGFATAIPIARAINPVTKTNWEGVGVKPDVIIAPDQALDAAVKMIKNSK